MAFILNTDGPFSSKVNFASLHSFNNPLEQQAFPKATALSTILIDLIHEELSVLPLAALYEMFWLNYYESKI
jgi:hypothetical protein